jgi:hypothetical protein
MIEFWADRIHTCPPTVVLCRVAYQLVLRQYRVNPLQFQKPERGIRLLAGDLYLEAWFGLAATLMEAADYIRRDKGTLALWRFDVCRRAGKATLRRLDQRRRASERSYPRITNRGVTSPCSWLEDLPEGLPDVRTPEGRARL